MDRVKLELNNTKKEKLQNGTSQGSSVHNGYVCTIEQLSDTERTQNIEQSGNAERTQSIEQPGNAERTQSIEQFPYGMKRAWNQDRKIQLKKGDIMNFGMYNGIPIEWIVIEKRADDLLILSRNVLDYRKFNATQDTHSYRQNIWEKSSLCRYLNGEFIEKSFSKEETDRILYGSDIDSSDEADTGEMLDDEIFMGRVFCLSCREARDFFADNRARIAFPLKSAVEKMNAMGQKKFIDKKIGSCSYWLRSRGYFGDYAAVVDSHGIIDDAGYNVGYMKIGIRPAMWIRQ